LAVGHLLILTPIYEIILKTERVHSPSRSEIGNGIQTSLSKIIVSRLTCGLDYYDRWLPAYAGRTVFLSCPELFSSFFHEKIYNDIFCEEVMHHLIERAHPEWQQLIFSAVNAMNTSYLESLKRDEQWLPGPEQIFNAFSMPLSSVKYILFGESPYPRKVSANGFAFWDANVNSLWGQNGLSKEVNRATSLRNLIKMLLKARGDLIEDVSIEAIGSLDKSCYISTAEELFRGMMAHGFLLLNASLVYADGKIPYHAREWSLFINQLLNKLSMMRPDISLVLFGNIAKQIPKTILPICLKSEHPYNLSFITNPNVIGFFKPFDLLLKDLSHDHAVVD
jgi:uracil-DNA glycosylase